MESYENRGFIFLEKVQAGDKRLMIIVLYGRNCKIINPSQKLKPLGGGPTLVLYSNTSPSHVDLIETKCRWANSKGGVCN